MTEGRIFFLKFDRVSPNIEHWTPMAALKRRSPNLSYRRKYIGVYQKYRPPLVHHAYPACFCPPKCINGDWWHCKKYIVLACKCGNVGPWAWQCVLYMCRLADQVLAICCRTLGPPLVKGRNMRERYSFVCRVIIAAAVMNPNLCTRLPRVRSTR